MRPASAVTPLTFFIPCELKNYANHGGHWTGKAGYQKRLREKAHISAREQWFQIQLNGARPAREVFGSPESPKSISLEAHVWNYFDAHDGLRNACKPLVDGLVRARVIHSDAHDSGHQFLYTQILDRRQRGVLVTVEPSRAALEGR